MEQFLPEIFLQLSGWYPVGPSYCPLEVAWLQERERQLFSGQEWWWKRAVFKREVTTNLTKWRVV